MKILAYLLKRFAEPSSYAGMGAILAALGLSFSDSMLGQIAVFFAAGCGLLAVVLKERGIIPAIALVAALGAGSLALSACAPWAALTDALEGAAGKALLAGVENYVPGVGAVVDKIDTGLKTAEPEIRMVCGGLSWADGAFKFLARHSAAIDRKSAAEAAVMKSVDAICDNPPTDLLSATKDLVAAWKQIRADLKAAK